MKVDAKQQQESSSEGLPKNLGKHC